MWNFEYANDLLSPAHLSGKISVILSVGRPDSFDGAELAMCNLTVQLASLGVISITNIAMNVPAHTFFFLFFP